MLTHWEWEKAPILYLDVDDTLIQYRSYSEKEWWLANPEGAPANGVKEFLEFIRDHFEVRWLTCWCPSGHMDIDRRNDLARILSIDRILIWQIFNPKTFWAPNERGLIKTRAIDWDDPRPWVWVEDDILPDEAFVLKGRHVFDNWIPCNVSENPNRLLEVMEILKKRFDIH